jgi:hypothetical protein
LDRLILWAAGECRKGNGRGFAHTLNIRGASLRDFNISCILSHFLHFKEIRFYMTKGLNICVFVFLVFCHRDICPCLCVSSEASPDQAVIAYVCQRS